MKYMGSKNRYAKEFLPIILRYRKVNQYYVEPFCGGCNVIDKVDGKRIASDNHHQLIALCKALQEGWIPPQNVSEELFDKIKSKPEQYEDRLVGYLMSQMTFGSVWYGGIRRDDDKSTNKMSKQAFNNVMKQSKFLKGIEFHCCNYDALDIPENSIIYCDPPYKGTPGYGRKRHNDFEYLKFWQWCRDMYSAGHSVFISEYCAPSDFRSVWEKKNNQSIKSKKNGTVISSVEKLFTQIPEIRQNVVF